jgi:hypothetical protein
MGSTDSKYQNNNAQNRITPVECEQDLTLIDRYIKLQKKNKPKKSNKCPACHHIIGKNAQCRQIIGVEYMEIDAFTYGISTENFYIPCNKYCNCDHTEHPYIGSIQCNT